MTNTKSTYSDLSPDCKAILHNKVTYGYHGTGVYTIHPADLTFSVNVVCDMDTQGGGWTVRNWFSKSPLKSHKHTH